MRQAVGPRRHNSGPMPLDPYTLPYFGCIPILIHKLQTDPGLINSPDLDNEVVEISLSK